MSVEIYFFSSACSVFRNFLSDFNENTTRQQYKTPDEISVREPSVGKKGNQLLKNLIERQRKKTRDRIKFF